MADIPSNLDKMNDIEIAANAPNTESLMNKIGANINGLIDGQLFINSQTFTANGNFNVPEGATVGLLFACGGGGGGGGVGFTGRKGAIGGTTIWADPTNGTVNFRGGEGAMGGGNATTLDDLATVIATVHVIENRNLSGAGQSVGGFGNANGILGGGSQRGGSSIDFAGAAGGLGLNAGGGGAAGPFGTGGTGGNNSTAGSNAAVNTGAGGGGAGGAGGAGQGGQGGNGAPLIIKLVTLTPLDIIPVTIGAGGIGNLTGTSGGNGGSGQLTIFY